MEFLAVNRPLDTATGERLSSTIPDHLSWISRGLRTGDIVRAGQWGRGGMCIIEAPDESSALRILGEDPLIVNGLVDVELAAIVPSPATPATPAGHA